jgi:hypothetical protein
MGGTSKQTQSSESRQSSEFAPWDQAVAPVQDLIHNIRQNTGNTGLSNTEQQAYQALAGNAQMGNPYAGGIDALAKSLLGGGGPDRTGMVQNTYEDFRKGMTPYTTMNTDPYSNEAFTRVTDQFSGDAMDRVKASYAAMGYDPTTASFGKSVGEGVTRAVAPLWLQQHNEMENRKLGAMNSLYGDTTAGILSGLDQTKLGNQQAGVGVATAALNARDAPWQRLLELEGAQFMTPVQRDAALTSMILPIAQLGGSQTGISFGKQEATKTMSPAEQAWGWMKAGGDLAKNVASMGAGGGGWGF